MPQRPKAEVRDAILSAAADTFAEQGFQGAKLTDIVVRAGTSIGNLYKYFANKDELFEAFLPPGFEAQLTRLIRARANSPRARASPGAHAPIRGIVAAGGGCFGSQYDFPHHGYSRVLPLSGLGYAHGVCVSTKFRKDAANSRNQ